MTDYLLESIKGHEGFRTKAYKDTVGVWTIGYGTNLQVLAIDEPLASKWLQSSIESARLHAQSTPEWALMTGPRRDVIVEMIYNMGPTSYDGFLNTRRAMREGRYADAANGMLESKWALQVGTRARRLAAQMKEGRPWQVLGVP